MIKKPFSIVLLVGMLGCTGQKPATLNSSENKVNSLYAKKCENLDFHQTPFSKTNFENFGIDNNLNINPFQYGLTACAGIAYIKSSFPFHYGVSLSDELCKEAKKISKEHLQNNLTPSSVMFHKVHASFIEEYDDIIDKELRAKDNVQFNFGPYFLNSIEKFATIDSLKSWVKEINRTDAPKSGIRNWLTTLKENPAAGVQILERVKALNNNFISRIPLSNPFEERVLNGKNIRYTPFYDIISISNIV
jgi:hypothetical protein